MKSYSFLSPLEFLVVFTTETLHVVGTAILFLIALPQLDAARGIMATNVMALIPGILRLAKKMNVKNLAIGGPSLVIQIAVIVSWIAMEWKTKHLPWALPIGLLLTSFGWWECYVTHSGVFSWFWKIKMKMSFGKINDTEFGREQLFDNSIKIPFLNLPLQLHAPDKKAPSRGPTYFVICLWKIGIFLMLMSLLLPELHIVTKISSMYTNFIRSFEFNEYILDNLNIKISEELIGWEKLWQSQTLVIIVQICSSWILYSVSKFAIKCNIERLGFALPMTLITPVSLWTLTPLCINRKKDPCAYSSSFPRYLFFNCPATEDPVAWLFTDDLAFWGITLLLTISFGWITAHIWHEHEKGLLLETPQIYSKYYYNGLMVDTSLMMNKCSDEKSLEKEKQKHQIYGCATMWHETRKV